MAKRLSSWDTYVKNAAHEDLELPLGEEVLTIQYPTKKRAQAFRQAIARGDTDQSVLALLGEANGAKVLAHAEDEPNDALDTLVIDVLRGFNLTGDDDDEADSARETVGKLPSPSSIESS